MLFGLCVFVTLSEDVWRLLEDLLFVNPSRIWIRTLNVFWLHSLQI